MNAQDVILGARVAHLRELKTEVEKLKAENLRLKDENAALASHFDLALVAANDLRNLPDGGRLVIVDGWNRILGADKTDRDRPSLERRWRDYLAEHPLDSVWIVYDGPVMNSFIPSPRLRVSYTGGTGAHRADRLIVDFVRMATWLGLGRKVKVETSDKDFLRTLKSLAPHL